MQEVYKIQAAFIKASTTLESQEGYHVWRLIKEVPQLPPMVVEVFEPHLAMPIKPNIAILNWHVKVESQKFILPHTQHTVYNATGCLTDVQARWGRAKEYLSSQSNSVHFNYHGPLDRITQYEMQNVIYNKLAKAMGIYSYSFIERSLFNKQIASHKLLAPYTLGLLLCSSNFWRPNVAKYKIVSAINYDVSKSITAVDITQLNSHKFIYRLRKAYHFWMLTMNDGGQNKVIEVIEGLPTQKRKTGGHEIIKHLSLKNRKALLSICTSSPNNNDKNMVSAHEVKTAYEGKDAADIWQRMKTFIPLLNNEQVPYSFLGLFMSMFGGKVTNGNSAYISIGFIFETLINKPNNPPVFKIPMLGGFSMPGLNNPVLSRKTIQKHFEQLPTSPTNSLHKFF